MVEGDVLEKITNGISRYYLYVGEIYTYKFSDRTLTESNSGKFSILCKLNKSHLTTKKSEEVFFKTTDHSFLSRINILKVIKNKYTIKYNISNNFKDGFDINIFKDRLVNNARSRLIEIISNDRFYDKEMAVLLSLYNINSYPNIKTLEDFKCLM